MFGSAALDVAIGLIFIFLLLSLIASAVSEILEGILKHRASDLERGIRELLNDRKGDDKASKWVTALYNHPLIDGLFRGDFGKPNAKPPSYIPARTFALALMDLVTQAKAGDGKPPTETDALRTVPSSGAAGATAPPPAAPAAGAPAPGPTPLRVAADTIADAHVRQALITLIDAAGNDISRARENIEAWYNSAMDRVSGWYKGRVQIITFCIGLVIAIAVNADTISIGTVLSRNKEARDALVNQASEYTKGAATQPSDTETSGGPSETQPTTKPTMTSFEREEKLLKQNADLLDQAGAAGVPLGWNTKNPYTNPPDIGGWLLKGLGWVITAMAVSLGAPFWFDLLNKFMVLRSTVKPREKSHEEKSKD
jgi:hypothetical protein